MSRLKETDDFGNRMKAYEAVETARKLADHMGAEALKVLRQQAILKGAD